MVGVANAFVLPPMVKYLISLSANSLYIDKLHLFCLKLAITGDCNLSQIHESLRYPKPPDNRWHIGPIVLNKLNAGICATIQRIKNTLTNYMKFHTLWFWIWHCIKCGVCVTICPVRSWRKIVWNVFLFRNTSWRRLSHGYINHFIVYWTDIIRLV